MSRVAWIAALGLVLAGLFLAGCGDDSGGDESAVRPLPAKGELLFIVRGEASVSGDRIEVRADTVEWFTDRPERRAGIGSAEELVETWQTYGFAADPPNAAITGPDVDAVVLLTDPETTEDGVGFAVRELRGAVGPADEGEVSVFIDSTGISAELSQLEPGQTVQIVLGDGTTVTGSYVGVQQRGVIAVRTDSGEQVLVPIRKIDAVIIPSS